MNVMDKIGRNDRPHPALCPGRGVSPGNFLSVRPPVRPIQQLACSRQRGTFLPLLGERAGVRAVNHTYFAFPAFDSGEYCVPTITNS